MDPLTLFALANGAVAAVKQGCQLYKDIKGAAGDIKGVLKDLDDQFHKLHSPEKPATVAQKNAYIQEKNRVVELNKRNGEITNIYQEIGEHLGTYYDNLAKCKAVFDEEERRSKTEIYSGDASLGKRALQRVLMRKQLAQMGTELQELMIYQSPPELGALWTEVNDMMQKLSKEQEVMIKNKIRIDHANTIIRNKKIQKIKDYFKWALAVLIVVAFFIGCIYLVVQQRKIDYPEYGDDFIPRRVTNYDVIIAEKNKKYWEEKAAQYRELRDPSRR
jgi:hypothetical protein